MTTANDTRIRYEAEWAVEIVSHSDVGVVSQRTASACFDTMEDAARHGCERNCYGSECFVNVQTWGYDVGLYQETGRKRWCWWDRERYLCQDGEVIEQVD